MLVMMEHLLSECRPDPNQEEKGAAGRPEQPLTAGRCVRSTHSLLSEQCRRATRVSNGDRTSQQGGAAANLFIPACRFRHQF